MLGQYEMMGGYQIVQNTVSSVYILSLKDEDTKEAGKVYRQEVVLISVTEGYHLQYNVGVMLSLIQNQCTLLSLISSHVYLWYWKSANM